MTDLEDMKKMISSHFNHEAAKNMNAIFQINLLEESNFHIAIDDGQFELNNGVHPEPSVTITTDLQTLQGMIEGNINGMQAFMTGKVKFSGDTNMAMQLKKLFS